MIFSEMMKDWQDLTTLTQGSPIVVECVRLPDRDIAIEGTFALPQLARLSVEDQVFVAAFLRSHGSIKEMEQVFAISYPTVKTRLNRIAARLEFIETDPEPSHNEILDWLERGELSRTDAVRQLEGK